LRGATSIDGENPRCRVSVVISTKGRPDQALTAVGSCLAQRWNDLEILLFDDDPARSAARLVADGVSTPRLRIFTTQRSCGYIANRNLGFAEARGEIVFSLDDDAYFTDPDSVARTVAIFDADPSIAAVALPYVEPQARRSQSTERAPFRSKAGDELRSFVGCAHALRREVVLKLGGYRELFVHQVEERDLSMRIWANGWRIVRGTGGPIVHKVDPRRDSRRVLFYACRNQILNEAFNTPMPDLLVRVPWLVLALLRYRFSWTTLPTKLKGLATGLFEAVGKRELRQPMRRPVYRRVRSLPGHGPLDFLATLPVPSAHEECREAAGEQCHATA
jgi:GT2 family glycosyltransferase